MIANYVARIVTRLFMQNKIMEYQQQAKLSLKEEIANLEVELWKQQKITRHLEESYG